nr:helix-turn-helix domain-containing protein [Chlorobaculum sp. 24CR]
MLLVYPWPGNVRELENVIERAVILVDENVIDGDDLPLSLQSSVAPEATKQAGLVAKVNSVEYGMIVEALTAHKGNITATAESLSLTRRTLSLKMQKFGMNYKHYR